MARACTQLCSCSSPSSARPKAVTDRREFLRGAASLGLSLGAWRGLAPRALTPSTEGLYDPHQPLPPWALELIEGQLRAWQGDGFEPHGAAQALRMRGTNPEWDFMARTYFVLALANLALRQPERAPRYLAVMESIIDNTLAVEAATRVDHFLLPYAHARPWRRQPPRSLFVDGELLAMLAAFELVAPGVRPRGPLRARARLVAEQMRAGPLLSAESYPDECWTFCNTTALAGLRMAEAAGLPVDASLASAWLERARAHLLHRDTGLLVSSYRWDGAHLDGPEGSSLWMSASNLLLVDADFAREQYTRARERLGRQLLGFGYAREWPRRARGPMDVDSGPVIPLLAASPGSSGLALLGARAFDDRPYLESLLASLELCAFPERREHDGQATRRYRASNLLGDAVLTYALCFGPLWARAEGRLG